MSDDEHRLFKRFEFYLDNDAVGQFNKRSFAADADAPIGTQVFPTSTGYGWFNPMLYCLIYWMRLMSSFELWRNLVLSLPNFAFLKVHATFAKVLSLCGATQCFESVERYAKRSGSFHRNGETDAASLPMSKLMLTAHRQG
jgi:hypothetical protein